MLITLANALAGEQRWEQAEHTFQLALAKCDEVHGRHHLKSCQILRGSAQMALARGEFGKAAAQLRTEQEVRRMHSNQVLSAAEGDEERAVCELLAKAMLEEASHQSIFAKKPMT